MEMDAYLDKTTVIEIAIKDGQANTVQIPHLQEKQPSMSLNEERKTLPMMDFIVLSRSLIVTSQALRSRMQRKRILQEDQNLSDLILLPHLMEATASKHIRLRETMDLLATA